MATEDSNASTPPANEAPGVERPSGRGTGNTHSAGRGQGRGGGGRGRQHFTGRGTHAPQGRGHGGGGGPALIAPTSGVPYGHVPGYLPGSSSLVEELDKRILIVLRDGRHLVGILRSFDQFSNLVLEDAFERRVHLGTDGVTCYADVPLGVYIVRGDSMVLMGQISSDDAMKRVELDEFEEIVKKSPSEALEWDFDKDLLA